MRRCTSPTRLRIAASCAPFWALEPRQAETRCPNVADSTLQAQCRDPRRPAESLEPCWQMSV
ncbi:hypothetical protein B0T26DRAFT_725044 [Lasiosphaeria miniovina]|uniref:Uncharacterized protein n=1 Tax=Lasiosphaeria miniovina TaxID=1954250 RepID=A0AA39ZYI4_9PEZI|nr:uncharacterized protein B0T26DRAFT_725044 [Lasiosphaeria miniovina]KAK0705953.1 hypothetical protein B0T26DRAFT_725044 [Lasiosphaeria miniovina]